MTFQNRKGSNMKLTRSGLPFVLPANKYKKFIHSTTILAIVNFDSKGQNVSTLE